MQHIITTSVVVWWLGVFAYIVKVKGSNLTNGVFVINSDKLIEYFPM